MQLHRIQRGIRDYIADWRPDIPRVIWHGKLEQAETYFFFRVVTRQSRNITEQSKNIPIEIVFYFNSSNVENGQELVSNLVNDLLETKWQLESSLIPVPNFDTPKFMNTLTFLRYDSGRAVLEGGTHKQALRIYGRIDNTKLF